MKRIFTFLIALIFIANISSAQNRTNRTNDRINRDRDVVDVTNLPIHLPSKERSDAKTFGCAEGSLFSNTLTGNTGGTLSEESVGYAAATSFATIGGAIQNITFWGASLSDGDCFGEDPMTFEIIFCENDNGNVGDIIHTFSNLSLSAINTGEALYNVYSIYEYTTSLPVDVEMTSGFVIIKGTSVAEPNCKFYWISKEEGNGFGMFNSGSGWDPHSESFTVCLGGIAPVCPAPFIISASNVNMTTADIEWDENGTATAWNIEFGPTGFTQGEGTTIAADSNPFTLTDLTASTSYDLYIQADCGGSTSIWTGPVTFSTSNCDEADKCGYIIEKMTAYYYGWNESYLEVVENGIVIAQVTLAEGLGQIEAGDDPVLETINICHDNNVDFIWRSASPYDMDAYFNIYDPNDQLIFAINHGYAEVDPGNLIDGGTVFNFTSNCLPPTCPKPTMLTANNSTSTTVDLSWVAGTETSWNIEYGSIGFVQGEGTIITVDANPYTLTGLEQGIFYDYYVQADCGGDNVSYWAEPVTFSASCDVISDFPWVDDLEEGMPCYTINQTNTIETWYWSNSEPIINGGGQALIEYDPTPDDQDEYLISPVFDFTNMSNPEISFYWQTSYGYSVDPNDNTDIYFKVTVDGGANWDRLWSEEAEGVFEEFETKNTIIGLSDYAGEPTFQFAFHYQGNDGAAFYLDDIKIDIATSINTNTVENIKIYPNPAKDIIHIENAKNAEIEIYNVLGAKVLSTENVEVVNISELDKGTYIVKVITRDEVFSKTIFLIK